MRPLSLLWFPALLLEVGCATTLRGGAQVRTLPQSSLLVEGQGTFGAGTGTADSKTQLVIPVAFSGGAPLRGGAGQATFESGVEWSAVSDSKWGYRVGPRVGGSIAGASGSYFALRGGPTLTLAKIRSNSPTPTVTLEGMVGAGISGDLDGSGMVGVGLSFGWDSYGSFNLPSGRPLRDARGEAWRAQVKLGSPSARIDSGFASPRLQELIGRFWLEEGLAEYASIASFARLALELRELHAPPSLVRRAWRAVTDELGHARACFALATRHLGFEIEPEPLLEVAPRGALTLAALARECWFDGCLGEGAAARFAARRARRATLPEAHRSLATVAREEHQHAELAWSILSWCLARGGAEIADALAVARGARPESLEIASDVPHSSALSERGLLGAADWHDCVSQTVARARPRLSRLILARNLLEPARGVA